MAEKRLYIQGFVGVPDEQGVAVHPDADGDFLSVDVHRWTVNWEFVDIPILLRIGEGIRDEDLLRVLDKMRALVMEQGLQGLWQTVPGGPGEESDLRL